MTQWGLSFLTNRRGVRIFPSELEKAAVENPEEPAAVPGHLGTSPREHGTRRPQPDHQAEPASAVRSGTGTDDTARRGIICG
jgi:hypothetical protein